MSYYDNNFQQSGVGNATNTGRGKLEYLQSRTSVSQYILRGDQHHLRFERGINEGSYVMNTYGYISQGEEIQLITNQVKKIIIH